MTKLLLIAMLLASQFCLDAHAQKWESTLIDGADKGKMFVGEYLETFGLEHTIDTASIRPYKNQSGQILFWVKAIEADEQSRSSLENFFESIDTFSDDENALLREAVKSGLSIHESHPRGHLPKGTPLEVATALYAGNCAEMSMALVSMTRATATHGYDYAALVRRVGLDSAYRAYKDDARNGRLLESLDNYTIVRTSNVPSGEVEFQYVQPGSDGESWLKYACSVWKRKNKPK